MFQVITWVVIPNIGGSVVAVKKISLWFIMMIQYLPRVFLIYPLSSQIVDATGIVTETAWAGAAYNLMLYLLGSHVSLNKLLLSLFTALC
jgi:cyclic nucleotide gated channel